MILKATIAANVIISGFEQISRVFDVNSLQYLEPESSSVIESEVISEIVARAPP